MKTFLLCFLIVCTNKSEAQLNSIKDTTETKCDEIFYRCEKPPLPKSGIKSYEKMLTNYLTEKNILISDGSAILLFTISKYGKVVDIKVTENSIKEIDKILNTINIFSTFWFPGQQNSYPVCAYKKIQLEVTNNQIKIVQNSSSNLSVF